MNLTAARVDGGRGWRVEGARQRRGVRWTPSSLEEEGAQRGWLCFKDRHSTVPVTFSPREEFRSTFADCTMDFRASACSDHSWHHRKALPSKEMEGRKQ